jgi:hypothetical protein
VSPPGPPGSRPPNAVTAIANARRRLEEVPIDDGVPGVLIMSLSAAIEAVESIVHASDPGVHEHAALKPGHVRLSFDVPPAVAILCDSIRQHMARASGKPATREDVLIAALTTLKDERYSSRPPQFKAAPSSRPPLITEEPHESGPMLRGSVGARGPSGPSGPTTFALPPITAEQDPFASAFGPRPVASTRQPPPGAQVGRVALKPRS